MQVEGRIRRPVTGYKIVDPVTVNLLKAVTRGTGKGASTIVAEALNEYVGSRPELLRRLSSQEAQGLHKAM